MPWSGDGAKWPGRSETRDGADAIGRFGRWQPGFGPKAATRRDAPSPMGHPSIRLMDRNQVVFNSTLSEFFFSTRV